VEREGGGKEEPSVVGCRGGVNSLVGLDTCGCGKTTHPADHGYDGPVDGPGRTLCGGTIGLLAVLGSNVSGFDRAVRASFYFLCILRFFIIRTQSY
jgi:hypothetical protein